MCPNWGLQVLKNGLEEAPDAWVITDGLNSGAAKVSMHAMPPPSMTHPSMRSDLIDDILPHSRTRSLTHSLARTLTSSHTRSLTTHSRSLHPQGARRSDGRHPAVAAPTGRQGLPRHWDHVRCFAIVLPFWSSFSRHFASSAPLAPCGMLSHLGPMLIGCRLGADWCLRSEPV